jgi:hypothetical protein
VYQNLKYSGKCFLERKKSGNTNSFTNPNDSSLVYAFFKGTGGAVAPIEILLKKKKKRPVYNKFTTNKQSDLGNKEGKKK